MYLLISSRAGTICTRARIGCPRVPLSPLSVAYSLRNTRLFLWPYFLPAVGMRSCCCRNSNPSGVGLGGSGRGGLFCLLPLYAAVMRMPQTAMMWQTEPARTKKWKTLCMKGRWCRV